MKKRMFLAAAAALIGIIMGLLPSAGMAQERKQTIMVYITGSDLESKNGAATRDLAEMLRARHDTAQTSVLVMIGGAKRWQSFPADQTVIYEISGARPKELTSGELMNMGSADTLVHLLEYGYEHYPAQSYSLILWDHGGGPLEGVCYDENFRQNGRLDRLSMTELGEALARSPFRNEKLEWIGFDACLMASVETAATCAPYARYMIASQEVEPGSGWDYSFLKAIQSGASGDEAGRIIVDSYHQSLAKGGDSQPFVTLSCIDLSRLDAVAHNMDRVFGELKSGLTEQSYSAIVRDHHEAAGIGRNESASANYDLVDMLGLAQSLECDASLRGELQAAVSQSIVYARSNVEGLNGLSMYFPYYNQQYYRESWREKYAGLAVSHEYLSFLDGYSKIWLGSELTDWSVEQETRLYVENGKTALTVEMSPEQQEHLALAQLYVLEALDNDRYLFASMSGMDQQGNLLTAQDQEKILVFTDPEGKPLSGCLKYQLVDDVYGIDAVLLRAHSIETADSTKEGEFTHVRINCLPPDENGWVQIISITDRPAEGELPAGKNEYRMEDYGCIVVIQNMCLPQYGEDGRMLPFNQWKKRGVDGVQFDLRDYAGRLRLRMIDRVSSGEEYAYVYELVDTQGRRHASQIIRMENEIAESIDLGSGQDQVLFHSDAMTVRLAGIDKVMGTVENGVKFWFDMSASQPLEDMYVVSGLVSVNQCLLPDFTLYFDPANGETQRHSVLVESSDLTRYGIGAMENVNWQMEARENGASLTKATRMTLPQSRSAELSDLHGAENLMALPDLCSAEDAFGMRFSLRRIQGDPAEGDVVLTLLAENTSGQPLNLGDYELLADGVFRETSRSYSKLIAPEEKVLVEFRLPGRRTFLDETWFMNEQRQVPQPFDVFGTNEIRKITFYNISPALPGDGMVQAESAAVLTLPEPFSYDAVRGSRAQRPDCVTAHNEEHFDLSVYQAEIRNGSLYLDVCLERFAAPQTYFRYCLNGERKSAEFYYNGWLTPIEGMSTAGTLCMALSEGELNAGELMLSIQSIPEGTLEYTDEFVFALSIQSGQADQIIDLENIRVME